jgi:hypothetical protein
MPEKGLQFFQLEGWGHAEHTLGTVEAAVRGEDVAVGIESEEVTEGLYGDDRAGDGFIFGNRLLDEALQSVPGTAAQIGEEFSIPGSGPGQAPRK